MSISRSLSGVVRSSALALLAACGGGGPAAPVPTPPAQYRVGGTVVGLRGSGLQLLNNGDNPTPVSAPGNFNFSRAADAGAAYAVTISAQPTSPAQSCTVAGGTGVIGTRDVTSVVISCIDIPTSSFTLRYVANNAHESFLVLDSPDDLRSVRFEFFVDHARVGCCEVWKTLQVAQDWLGINPAHVYFMGPSLSPYTNGPRVYEVRALDNAGAVLKRDSITVNADMTNSLVNGDAYAAASNGWTIDAGEINTRSYNTVGSALLNNPVSPWEQHAGGVRASGYFTTEGTPNRYVEMHQRVTVAFPGKTDGRTAVSYGGNFGYTGSGRSEMQVTFVGENLDGTQFSIVPSALRASSSSPAPNREWRYGQIPPGVHYIDVTVTIDARNSGEAFADNLWVSVLPWTH